MSRPNFFIVGAPKCGTTALSEYLRSHPHVFVSEPKEPHYFSEDFPAMRDVDTPHDYLKLFDAAHEGHTAIGEASVWYLYSRTAIPNIRAFEPSAKIIVMLRNPVDLVYSMHSQALMTVDEDEKSFMEAWQLQDSRAQGRNLPRHCREPALLQYGEVGKIGSQLERLYRVFDPDQIKPILFEDFTRQTSAVFQDVQEFLGVPVMEKEDFPWINQNKVYRFRRLANIIERPPQKLLSIANVVKRRFGISEIGLLNRLRSANTVMRPRPALPPSFRATLVDYFRDDIRRLSELLNRDLAAWLL